MLTPTGLGLTRWYLDREDAASKVTAGGTANTTEGNSRASRESGSLYVHSHGESIGGSPAGRSGEVVEGGGLG